MTVPIKSARNQTSPCSCSGDFHLIEKVNGIKYLYASLDRHPPCSFNGNKL